MKSPTTKYHLPIGLEWDMTKKMLMKSQPQLRLTMKHEHEVMYMCLRIISKGKKIILEGRTTNNPL